MGRGIILDQLWGGKCWIESFRSLDKFQARGKINLGRVIAFYLSLSIYIYMGDSHLMLMRSPTLETRSRQGGLYKDAATLPTLDVEE